MQIESQSVLANQLVTLFRQFLAVESVLFLEEERRPYECDGLSVYRQLPLLVVLPETVEQVQRVLRICSEHKVPVVARGAGTGLSGGALPLADGVLLSLAKFNQILDVDLQNRCARVQPGVRNLAISEAVAAHNLYYAPILHHKSPVPSVAMWPKMLAVCIASNTGSRCITSSKLEIVTMEGERLTIGSDALDPPGFDLLALLTGSEGMLGVIVEVTVKLLPKPETVQVLLAAFDDVVKAGDAVGNIIAEGIIPAGLEMMDNPAIRAAEAFAQAGYPEDAAAILLCELDGCQQEVEVQVEQVKAVCRIVELPMCVLPPARPSVKNSGRSQGGISRRGAYFARLLLHGRHHSAPSVGQSVVGYRSVV